MKKVTVDNVTIGQGAPKIIVPLVGKTRSDILAEAKAIKDSQGDLAEWRIDFFEEVEQPEKVAEFSKEVKEALQKPLLITFRNQKEGGNLGISADKYARIYKAVMEKGSVDLIDVELSQPDKTIETLALAAHVAEVKLVISSHDTKKTPTKMEMFARFQGMQEAGADICKLAVTPQTSEDLLNLFAATQEMTEHYAKCPVVTMAMGDLGKVTRLAGQLFGSAATFATVGEPSAPGQMTVEEVKQVIDLLASDEASVTAESIK